MFEAFERSLLELGPCPGFTFSSEQVERCYDVGEVRDEFPVEVCKSRERLDPLDRGGGFPFPDGVKLLLIHSDLSLSNDHAQKLHARGVEHTFQEFDGQTMFLKSLENPSHSFVMKSQVPFGVDAKVIHVDLQPFFSDHVGEDMVHKHLKHGWCIAETKEHDSGFKESHGGDERRFPLVFFSNADVVVSPADVEFGE